MTAKAALCQALLEGRVLNVKNCFETIGLTNIGREVPRMVEKAFNVVVSRTHRTGKSRFGTPVYWVDFRLNASQHNIEGMKAMLEYIKSQRVPGSLQPSRTRKEEKAANSIKQTNLFVNSL